MKHTFRTGVVLLAGLRVVQMIGVTLLCILVIALLSGCVPEQAVRQGVEWKLEASRHGVAAARAEICQIGSVGVIAEEFWRTPAGVDLWSRLCMPSFSLPSSQ